MMRNQRIDAGAGLDRVRVESWAVAGEDAMFGLFSAWLRSVRLCLAFKHLLC